MKILLAEDSALLRAGLAQLLRAMGHEVIEVADGDALLRAGRTHEVDLVLSDVRMPPKMADDGLAAVHQLRHERAAEGRGTLPAIVLSQYVAAAYLDRLLDHGAFGYLLKERDDLELCLGIASTLRGGAPIDPFIAKRIMQEFAAAPKPAASEADSTMPPLSGREHEILQLVAQGMTNREIAEQLHLSKFTVECHVKKIYQKMSVSSRTRAIHMARQHGLIA